MLSSFARAVNSLLIKGLAAEPHRLDRKKADHPVRLRYNPCYANQPNLRLLARPANHAAAGDIPPGRLLRGCVSYPQPPQALGWGRSFGGGVRSGFHRVSARKTLSGGLAICADVVLD